MNAFPPLYDRLDHQSPDALLTLISMHRLDPRPDKIDVGVGVYRDSHGRTPVLQAVKAAEAQLLALQTTKAYLGAEGDPQFSELIAGLIFGAGGVNSRRCGVQTPGGSGALRLGAELIARMNPLARVWIGDPTWPNHLPIFAEAGLETVMHRYFDPYKNAIDVDGMMSALASARAGDILLLHGCCHNPTGTEFTTASWRELADLCNFRGILPFIDLAYQGIGNGLDEDVEGVRLLLDAVPNALVAYSCDKNFGLYRERVGALVLQGTAAPLVDLARSNLLQLSRSLWSMPPDHGAAIVRIILEDAALTHNWSVELREMRTRINSTRTALAALHPGLAFVARQRGLFSLVPLTAQAVSRLREVNGIYMAPSGRINIAGLSTNTLPRFAEHITAEMSGRTSQI